MPLVQSDTERIFSHDISHLPPRFGYRGNTTFNGTLCILCSPIRATLALQGPGVILNWTNGVPPFAVQWAADLGPGDWTELVTNAIPPLTVPLDAEVRFYRVLGQ